MVDGSWRSAPTPRSSSGEDSTGSSTAAKRPTTASNGKRGPRLFGFSNHLPGETGVATEPSLKQRLRSGDTTVGSWITLAHPAIAEIMAKAGFDWLVVDLEHSVITIREAEELIRVIELCGSVPLVRVSANEPVQIKRVMDAGAHGVVVPMVNSREDAARAVASVKYPPRGARGAGLARAQGYGTSFEE